jgi:hypothetical protein
MGFSSSGRGRNQSHPKVEGVGIDWSMDWAPLTSSPRLTHCPSMQIEVTFKSKDSYISQKTPHL